jgi:hypothetical protein
MGGRAFIWLKGGCAGPKSVKQPERDVAELPTILRIGWPEEGKLPVKSDKDAAWLYRRGTSEGYG